ncbi:Hypothetical predicted protein [Octopus vulgaris]|uniref:VWFA domain-containing protein n=1 Tax=Octopus vulgaris TaxID=6645 RepID=A0AA36BRW5_OCTVU|nr:Hypothetical predicted protein [Octopus vulgaris]
MEIKRTVGPCLHLPLLGCWGLFIVTVVYPNCVLSLLAPQLKPLTSSSSSSASSSSFSSLLSSSSSSSSSLKTKHGNNNAAAGDPRRARNSSARPPRAPPRVGRLAAGDPRRARNSSARPRAPRVGRFDCVVSAWSSWTRSGAFQVRYRSRLQKSRNGGLRCPPLVTARKIRHNRQHSAQLPFAEASRRFLSNVIRGGSLAGDEATNLNSFSRSRDHSNNSYIVKHKVWPERLLLTVLDDSLCVISSTLGLKTKFLVLSLLESLCGSTFDKNAPTVGLQTYSVKSRLVMPLKKPATKHELRHAVLSYYTHSVKLLQLDRALDRTVSILNTTMRKKKYWRSAVLLVLSSWNYCDENTLGEAVLIKEHSDVYVLLIGPEPDSTQIVCFSSLASQPIQDHYIRLPDSETLNKFIAKVLVAQFKNTFCYNQ